MSFMRILPWLAAMLLVEFAMSMSGQTFSAHTAEPAHIAGTVTDTNGDVIPEAIVAIKTDSENLESAVSNDNGFFQLDNVIPGKAYQITVRANGFADWKSSTIPLSPGQFDILNDVKLTILGKETSVTVVASREELAAEEVKIEEHQRVMGFIPNFYVSYDKNAVPLTPKLKFHLALKVAIDPVTFAGTGFVAAINQASHYPDYVEGMKGYGQRFGSTYLNGLTDIMIGGAILPSLLRQDPRYFYQGTGTSRSRLIHALSSPIICRGDNGQWQPNYSSLGGYLASGAIANAYYPAANRGSGLLFRIFGLDLSADVANGFLQEFVIGRRARRGKDRN
jgi:Carboxypeptidase regulatory-like domain